MFDSIRIRLTLWYVSILAIVIFTFAGLTYFLVVRVLAEEMDENLGEMALNFKTAIDAERADELEKASVERDIVEAVDESRFRDYGFAVYTADNRPIASTLDDTNLHKLLLNRNAETAFYSIKTTAHTAFRVHRVTLEFGTDKYQLFVLHSLEEQTDFLNRLQLIFFIAVPLTLLLAGLGGYFLARKSLAPMVDMSRRAATISATNLHERLLVTNERDELGNLAQVFNALLLRLDNSFEQQRRFMADASHELRTPLAIVRGESEVALLKEDRSNAELRESLSIVNDESKRLTKIVEDLFTLARADAGQFKTHSAEVYLDEIIADCVRKVRVLAKKKNVSIELSVEEMPLGGDEQLLRRLFINLLDNAIKYNRDGGRVSISSVKDEQNYHVSISDSGSGIPEMERAKIFERFYRADKARSRQDETETSGAGLGLSIAQWIAGLHRGKIELVGSNEQGSCFSVILPRN